MRKLIYDWSANELHAGEAFARNVVSRQLKKAREANPGVSIPSTGLVPEFSSDNSKVGYLVKAQCADCVNYEGWVVLFENPRQFKFV